MKYYLIESQEEGNLLYVSRYAPEFHRSPNQSQLDKIIFSWEDTEDDFIKNLVVFLLRGQITTQADIENELELSGIYEKDYTIVVRGLLKSVSFDNVMKKQYIKNLRESRTISERMKKRLVNVVDLSLNNQTKFLRNFKYDNIDFKKIKSHENRARKIYISNK